MLGLDVAFLALDADPVLVLDPVAAFLTSTHCSASTQPSSPSTLTWCSASTQCLPSSPSTRSLLFLGPFPFSVPSLSR
jgi:hypothetical protein